MQIKSLQKRIRDKSINSQIAFAFLSFSALIIGLQVLSYWWISEMITINSLKEISVCINLDQMQMKSASNEFILREKTNEKFFASGKSIFLERYAHYLRQLREDTDHLKASVSSFDVDATEIDKLEASILAYDLVFNQMVMKIQARGYGDYGLIGEFDKSIKNLLQYDFGIDKIAVLNLQLFVKNYLLTGDEQLVHNISNEVFNFTMVLEQHIQDHDVARVAQILQNYETIFKELTRVDSELGIYTGGGLQSSLFNAIDELDESVRLVNMNEYISKAFDNALRKLYFSVFLIAGAAVIAAFAINKKLYRSLVVPVHKMKAIISQMSRGELPNYNISFKVDDLNEMAKALNNLLTGTRTYQEFANNVGNGNLDTVFSPLSENDILGNSLLAMQESLKISNSRQQQQMIELQRVNAELDSFTYHASHDLRAPLTSIQGLAHLGAKEKSEEISQTYFKMIMERVSHMDVLLKDLISIYHNNKTETRLEIFRFDEEMKSLLESLAYPGHPFDIQLKLEQATEFVSDPVRLRAILRNLVSNAFKYYNPDRDRPYISICVAVCAHKASVTIQDNGIGIDDAYKEKIYSMFFRATTRSTGTGLGLYIVKSTAEKLGGTISFTSVLHEGTTFYVTVPNKLEQYRNLLHKESVEGATI